MKLLKRYMKNENRISTIHGQKKTVGSRPDIVGADGVKNVDVADFETDHNGRESLNLRESLLQHNKV